MLDNVGGVKISEYWTAYIASIQVHTQPLRLSEDNYYKSHSNIILLNAHGTSTLVLKHLKKEDKVNE